MPKIIYKYHEYIFKDNIFKYISKSNLDEHSRHISRFFMHLCICHKAIFSKILNEFNFQFASESLETLHRFFLPFNFFNKYLLDFRKLFRSHDFLLFRDGWGARAVFNHTFLCPFHLLYIFFVIFDLFIKEIHMLFKEILYLSE